MTDVASKPMAAQAKQRPRGRDLKDVDFAHLRTELSAIRSATGVSLYEHLQKVFEQLILHNPSCALERFEEVSCLIKRGQDPCKFLKFEDVRQYAAVAKDQEDYIRMMAQHFVQPEPDEDGNVQQPDPLATQVQDLLSESRIYQWAGIGFGE